MRHWLLLIMLVGVSALAIPTTSEAASSAARYTLSGTGTSTGNPSGGCVGDAGCPMSALGGQPARSVRLAHRRSVRST
jgi:hypothetical protein